PGPGRRVRQVLLDRAGGRAVDGHRLRDRAGPRGDRAAQVAGAGDALGWDPDGGRADVLDVGVVEQGEGALPLAGDPGALGRLDEPVRPGLRVRRQPGRPLEGGGGDVVRRAGPGALRHRREVRGEGVVRPRGGGRAVPGHPVRVAASCRGGAATAGRSAGGPWSGAVGAAGRGPATRSGSPPGVAAARAPWTARRRAGAAEPTTAARTSGWRNSRPRVAWSRPASVASVRAAGS